MNNERLYLAYGSNLHLGQMSLRCRDAEVVGATEIPDYRLSFQGHQSGAVATIEPAEGFSVPVLVWNISPRDERSLDFYEGYPSFYEKQNFTVEVDGKEVEAMAYVMTPGHVYGSPVRSYFQTIQEGYRTAGFASAVLAEALAYSKEMTGTVYGESEPEQMGPMM